MQSHCSKCGEITTDSDDLHCRRILQAEIKQLLLLGKEDEANKLVSNSTINEKWKREMLQRLYLTPEVQQEIQKKRSNQEKIRQRQQLAISQVRNQFAELANKYDVNINKVVDQDGPTLLAKILSKLDEKEALNDLELKWLEEKEEYKLLANYYCKLIERFGDITDGSTWDLSKASKFFIKAGMPGKAIEITDGFLDRLIIDQGTLIRDAIASGAVYTSRGAAFRNLGELDKARQCAEKAIDLSPKKPHPYNLLGGICYDEGNPEDADKYFEKAIELGSDPRIQEMEIRNVLRESGAEIRKAVIDHLNYLYRKDPQKYGWVRQFR